MSIENINEIKAIQIKAITKITTTHPLSDSMDNPSTHLLRDANGKEIQVSDKYMIRHQPQVGGYYLVDLQQNESYIDGQLAKIVFFPHTASEEFGLKQIRPETDTSRTDRAKQLLKQLYAVTYSIGTFREMLGTAKAEPIASQSTVNLILSYEIEQIEKMSEMLIELRNLIIVIATEAWLLPSTIDVLSESLLIQKRCLELIKTKAF